MKYDVRATRKDNGDLTKTDRESAEILGKYFKEIFTTEDTINMPVVAKNNRDWQDANVIGY